MIVGQLNLINELERKVKNNTLPRFIIFVGPKGSQKLEMAQYITSILYHNKVIVDDIMDKLFDNEFTTILVTPSGIIYFISK